MPQSETKLISIIIPSLHRPDLTRRCIESLAQQDLCADQWEVIVAENDARPDSILPDPLPPNTRRILLTANYGTTGSINRGLAASSSKYVLILNNDVELDSHYLSLLTATLQDERYAFATGKLLRATDHTLLDGAGDGLLQGGCSYRLGHGDPDQGQFDEKLATLVGCGAATLFRRSVLEEAQGLDEIFFAYLDDVDLCLRTHLLGYQGLYVPTAFGYHIGSATLGAPLHPKVIELLTRNQLLLLIKTYPIAVWIRSLPRIVVCQILWLLLVAQKRELKSYMRGIWGAVRFLPQSLRKRRQVMSTRRVSNTQLLELLRYSENQVFTWHHSRLAASRSTLLNVYFWLFGKKTRRA